MPVRKALRGRATVLIIAPAPVFGAALVVRRPVARGWYTLPSRGGAQATISSGPAVFAGRAANPHISNKVAVNRLLYIANPFPPKASAGNARHLRFLHHLPEFGWEPTVLTGRAKGSVAEPTGVCIERALSPSLDSLNSAARWVTGVRGRVRGAGRAATPSLDALRATIFPKPRSADVNRWLFVPDTAVGWVPPAAALGLKLVRERGFDAIVSSSHYPSTHLVAAWVATRSGLPWLADFRDQWATNRLRVHKTSVHRRLDFVLERWALDRATAVTAINQVFADDLLARYPFLADRVSVLPNGFDEADTPDEVVLPDGFWFVHTGRLYSRGAPVAEFLDALATLPADVGVVFVGVEGTGIRAYADAIGLGDRVRTEPLVPRTRALGFQQAAGALLLINPPGPDGTSSKLFEYLHSGRPIFAMTSEDSCAAAILAESGGGVVPGATRSLAGELAQFLGRARSGQVAAPDLATLGRYDARTLTAQLAGLLDAMTGTAAGRPGGSHLTA